MSRSILARGVAMLEGLESRRLLSAAPVTTAPGGPTTPPPSTTSSAYRGIGITFHAEAGEPFSGIVARLQGVGGTSGLSATINWGDGTPDSKGTFVVTPVATILGIAGDHTYAAGGTYTVDVVVTRHVGPPVTPIAQVIQITSHAIVTPDNGTGVTLNEPAGKSFTADLGSFTYVPPPVASPVVSSDPTTPITPVPVQRKLWASINWGDGSVSLGLIQNEDSDLYDVIGTHTYAAVDQYQVEVTVYAGLLTPTPIPVTDPSSVVPPGDTIIADWFSTINALPTPVSGPVAATLAPGPVVAAAI